jgi:ParB/RepB/Spo0J family partition protein
MNAPGHNERARAPPRLRLSRPSTGTRSRGPGSQPKTNTNKKETDVSATPTATKTNTTKAEQNGNGKAATATAERKPDAATANGGDTRAEALYVPIDKIAVQDEFNPRREFDQEKIDGLAATIKRLGILDPLLVEPDGNGGYLLREGERRLRAARKAGLSEVPVTVRKLDGTALLAAIITDAQKEGLSPVEQARSYERLIAEGAARNMTEVAEAIGRPLAFVRERMRLLRLPEDVQQHIHEGKLPLALVPTLEAMAKVSAEVASASASLVVRGKVSAALLFQRPWQVVRTLDEYRWPDGKPVAVECNQGHYIQRLPIPDDAEDVREWIKHVVKEGEDDIVRFGSEAVDAARSYRCLLEYKTGGQFPASYAFICDRAFIADLLRAERERRRQEAERAEQEAAERAAQEAKGGGGQSAEDQVREERRKQREQAERQKGLAHGANLDFWRRLNEQKPSKTLTVEDLRPLVYAALAHDADKIAARLAYCRPDWQHVEVKRIKATGKDKQKVTYPAPDEAAAMLFAWLDEAKTAVELARRARIALACATYADNRCEPQSRRVVWSPPNGYTGGHKALDALPGMIAKTVKGALPKRLAEKARKPY